ncbi:TetR/AcrR family transcriptional regulator [Spirillospora sp. NPDC052269]
MARASVPRTRGSGAAAGGTEEQIRRAAVHLFATRGFHATGIRQLAKAVGINSSTLYHYMGTKEELLFAITQDSSRRLIDAAGRLSPDLNPQARLCGLVYLHVWSHATHPEETAVVDNELRSLDGDRLDRAVELRDRYEKFWADTIADGCASGTFAVQDQRIARIALLQMCSGVAGWYSTSGEMSLRDLTTTYAQMALSLLSCSRDHRTIERLLDDLDLQPAVAAAWPETTPSVR